MIRYYQNQGSMPAANGLATPAALDQFLSTLPDGYLNSSQLVNFWRLVNFTGGNLDVSVESADLNTVRTLIAAGDPVLIGLALTQDASPSGGVTVGATGIAADGGITILDPNAYFGRLNLNDYLYGFTVNGHAFQATVLSAMRLLPRAPSAAGFLLNTISQPANALPALAAASAAGSCSLPLVVQNAYPVGSVPPPTVLASRFIYCDGTQALYQVTVGVSSVASAPYQASLIDLAVPDSAAVSPAHDLSGSIVAGYQVSRVSGQLSIASPAISFAASSVLNAASFMPGISPGGLFTLFGSGLSGSGSATAVFVGDQAATVLLATPFQINAQVPPGLSPGASTVQVSSAYGNYSQPVTLQPASPGVFVIGTALDGTSAQGAVVNQDGALNGATSPARRGDTVTIYCTGLGATVPKGGLSTTSGTVTVILSATELPSSFSGLTPGFVGLYQVNFPIPLQSAPGLSLPLVVEAGGVTSNSVTVAVQ
jgi:uncharacterized protein (TIGR03437 family)